MDKKKGKNLDSLQKRRNLVRSLTQRSQQRRRSPQKFKNELQEHQPITSHNNSYNQDSSSNQSNDNIIIENNDTEMQPVQVKKEGSRSKNELQEHQPITSHINSYNQDSSSNQSNDIIENSDTEMQPIKVQKEANITINTSSDGDINTSMICLPRSHTSFFGHDMGNLIPPKSPFKLTTSTINDQSKVNILSIEVIKRADSLISHSRGSSQLNTFLEDSATASKTTALDLDSLPVDSCTAQPEASVPPIKTPPLPLEFDSLPAHFYATQPEASGYVPPIKPPPPLDLNSLPADSCIVQPKASGYVSPVEPPLPLDLNSLPADSWAAQPEVACYVSPVEMSPPLDLDSLPAHFYATQPKASCSVSPVEPPPPPLNLDSLTANSCTVQLKDSSSLTSIETQSVSRKRRKTSSFKKSCIDFLSDEELLDFSAGSSDDWTCNESESSESSGKKNKKRRKKKEVQNNDESSKMRKKEKQNINKREQRKKLKGVGKAYETEKGDKVEEKKMQVNPCEPEKCKRGCFNITEERRISLFTFFWSLDPQRRKDWLINCTRVKPVARRRTDSPASRRSLSYEYYINNGDDHQKVCQKFLLETLNVTQKYLLYNLSHSKEGMSRKDLRTRTILDKYSPEAKTYAKSFIEKLPAVPSHYNRKRTSRVYLPQELKNVSNLYRLYQKECENNDKEAVGDSVFRNIFNDEYNISFHTPKKDKCLICTKAERNDVLNEAEKEILEAHLREKKCTYQRFLAHQKLKSQYNDTVTTSFDLQKVLTTPHGDSMLLGYARKYAVFNFTLYESGTQNVYCYIWGECDAKRGSQEIATCLYKYFQEVDGRNVKHLILYCDSCAGQNKNKVVLTVINYFLKESKSLQTIQLNFLLPGHTYMPVDSVHATIEREIQKITVWSPSQWMPYISSARKRPRPYSVIVMDNSDFISWEELASKTFTNETLKKLRFKNIRIATFKKKSTDQVEIKYSTDEKTIAEKIALAAGPAKKLVRGKRKGSGKGKGKAKGQPCASENTDDCQGEGNQTKEFVLCNLYNARLPISTAKYKDLKQLCENGVIPRPYHHEFLQLPHKMVKETLAETDDEDETEEDD